MILDPSHDAPVEGPACKPCHGRTLSCGSQLFTFQRSGRSNSVRNPPGSKPVETVPNGGGKFRPLRRSSVKPLQRFLARFPSTIPKNQQYRQLRPSNHVVLWMTGGKLVALTAFHPFAGASAARTLATSGPVLPWDWPRCSTATPRTAAQIVAAGRGFQLFNPLPNARQASVIVAPVVRTSSITTTVHPARPDQPPSRRAPASFQPHSSAARSSAAPPGSVDGNGPRPPRSARPSPLSHPGLAPASDRSPWPGAAARCSGPGPGPASPAPPPPAAASKLLPQQLPHVPFPAAATP